MRNARFSNDNFNRLKTMCAEHRDQPWVTRDKMERELMSAAISNIPPMIKEINRLRAESNKAMAMGGVNWCMACGDEMVLDNKSFCQTCNVNINLSEAAV